MARAVNPPLTVTAAAVVTDWRALEREQIEWHIALLQWQLIEFEIPYDEGRDRIRALQVRLRRLTPE